MLSEISEIDFKFFIRGFLNYPHEFEYLNLTPVQHQVVSLFENCKNDLENFKVSLRTINDHQFTKEIKKRAIFFGRVAIQCSSFRKIVFCESKQESFMANLAVKYYTSSPNINIFRENLKNVAMPSAAEVEKANLFYLAFPPTNHNLVDFFKIEEKDEGPIIPLDPITQKVIEEAVDSHLFPFLNGTQNARTEPLFLKLEKKFQIKFRHMQQTVLQSYCRCAVRGMFRVHRKNNPGKRWSGCLDLNPTSWFVKCELRNWFLKWNGNAHIVDFMEEFTEIMFTSVTSPRSEVEFGEDYQEIFNHASKIFADEYGGFKKKFYYLLRQLQASLCDDVDEKPLDLSAISMKELILEAQSYFDQNSQSNLAVTHFYALLLEFVPRVEEEFGSILPTYNDILERTLKAVEFFEFNFNKFSDSLRLIILKYNPKCSEQKDASLLSMLEQTRLMVKMAYCDVHINSNEFYILLQSLDDALQFDLGTYAPSPNTLQIEVMDAYKTVALSLDLEGRHVHERNMMYKHHHQLSEIIVSELEGLVRLNVEIHTNFSTPSTQEELALLKWFQEQFQDTDIQEPPFNYNVLKLFKKIALNPNIHFSRLGCASPVKPFSLMEIFNSFCCNLRMVGVKWDAIYESEIKLIYRCINDRLATITTIYSETAEIENSENPEYAQYIAWYKAWSGESFPNFSFEVVSLLKHIVNFIKYRNSLPNKEFQYQYSPNQIEVLVLEVVCKYVLNQVICQELEQIYAIYYFNLPDEAQKVYEDSSLYTGLQKWYADWRKSPCPPYTIEVLNLLIKLSDHPVVNWLELSPEEIEKQMETFSKEPTM